MNEDKNHIGQLTPALMQQYLDGTLSSDMQHKMERYLLDHTFEAEAMEGFEAVGIKHLDSEIEQMKKNLFDDKKETKVIPIWQQYWKVAAVVTVLIVSTFLILNLGQEQIISSDTELALKEEPNPIEETVVSKDQKEIEDEVIESPESINEDLDELPTSDALKLDQSINDNPQVEQLAMMDEEVELEEFDMAEIADADMTVADDFQEAVSIAPQEAIAEQSRVAASGALIRKKSIAPIPNTPQVVTGTITSETDGSPIMGANVIVLGTTLGTTSDSSGNYQITVPEGQPSLAFSFIGYGTEEVAVGDKDILNTMLTEDMSQLSEIVVIAEGLETKAQSLGYTISKKTDIHKQDAEPLIGFEAYNKYLQDSLRYPQAALDNQASGKVTLELTISESGQIIHVLVKRGLGHGCGEEAIRLIKTGPAWQNAIKRGNPTEEKVKVDVEFKQ